MNKLIIAHRGASFLARENTLEAFRKAIELHADMIEFDVRRTKDRRYVIHHDPQLAGIPLNRTAFREIREIAGTLGFHVPELEEVLELVRGKTGLDIELKEEGYERELLERLADCRPQGNVLVSSFHGRSIDRVKKICRDAHTGFIFDDAAALTADILSGDADWLLPERHLATDEVLDRMRGTGKKIAVWTVNDSEQMKRFLGDVRIDGIITDRPDVAFTVRATGSAPP